MLNSSLPDAPTDRPVFLQMARLTTSWSVGWGNDE